jgi:hypothetical protein
MHDSVDHTVAILAEIASALFAKDPCWGRRVTIGRTWDEHRNASVCGQCRDSSAGDSRRRQVHPITVSAMEGERAIFQRSVGAGFRAPNNRRWQVCAATQHAPADERTIGQSAITTTGFRALECDGYGRSQHHWPPLASVGVE